MLTNSHDELSDLFEKKLTLEPVKEENINVKQLMNTCKLINERISKEVCKETVALLSDMQCLDRYKECKSLKKNVLALTTVLEKNKIDEEQGKKITDDYLLSLIPPGLKGVIRGNKFNESVKHYILSLNLDKELYDIQFETKCSEYETSEIPYWFVLQKSSRKVIIGMNQLDLWGGGAQLNRASKYIMTFPDNSEKVRLVCVVANPITLTSEKNKAFKLFQKGFEEDTLCYLKNLKPIIESFFKNK